MNNNLPLPEHDYSAQRASGHWVLARLGKKVLRPGGRETTNFLLNNLPISGSTVVEFAPGLGVTAQEILRQGPAHYVGIEENEHAAAHVRAILPAGSKHEVITASAAQAPAEPGSADVVIGEAILTMVTDKNKLEILRKAHDLLRDGGLYGIHELSLGPDTASEELKTRVRTDLARAVKVNARPLTVPEWIALLKEAGFEVINLYRADMALLQPARMLADEGLLGTARILRNLLREPKLRARVLTMRATFKRYKRNLGAVGIIARKV